MAAGYLCLDRKTNERIFIGENKEIEILVIRLYEDKKGTATVRLGFNAPRNVPIIREELIKKEAG